MNNEVKKPTYEELEKEVLQLTQDLEDTTRQKEQKITELGQENRKLQEKIKELENKPVQQPIYTWNDTPFNRLIFLLKQHLPAERIREELGNLEYPSPLEIREEDFLTEEDKKKVKDYSKIEKELNEWHTNFNDKTPNQVLKELQELNAKPTNVISEVDQQKINNYDSLLKERDKLLIKLKQKEQELPSPLSKKISDEIIKSYKAPTHLYGFYLKLMNSFKDWTIYGNDEQQLASKQNEVEIDRVIRFLLTHQSQEFKPNQNI